MTPDMPQAPRPIKIVALSTPVSWHGENLTSIKIQEPSAATYLKIGQPQIWVHNQSGGGALVDDSNAMTAYIAECCKIENAPHLMTQLTLSDGIAIREIILGFFSAARLKMSAG